MPKLLSDAQVAQNLKALKGWKHEGKFITKRYEFPQFMDVVAFVNEIAEVAEREEHHPDINIRYTSIKLSIQTHSEGGVTEWDISLAKAIDILEESVKRETR